MLVAYTLKRSICFGLDALGLINNSSYVRLQLLFDNRTEMLTISRAI